MIKLLKISFFIFCFYFSSLSSLAFSKTLFVAQESTDNNLDDLIISDESDEDDPENLINIESTRDDDIEEEDEDFQINQQNFSKPSKKENTKNNEDFEVVDDSDLEKEFIVSDEDIEGNFSDTPDEDFSNQDQTSEEEDLEEELKKEDSSLQDELQEELEEDELGEDELGEDELEESTTEAEENEQNLDIDDSEETFSEEDLDDNNDSTSSQSEESSLESNSDLNTIRNIRYIAAKNQIVIDGSQMILYQASQNSKNNQLIIEITQARLSKSVKWPYILRDFQTDFGMIQADQKDSSTVRLVIQLKEGASFPGISHGSSDQHLVISYSADGTDSSVSSQAAFRQDLQNENILQAKTLEDIYLGSVEFSGQPISFHVIDAPIKQVFRFISEESGLNLVIGESVTGTVTLKLENVPWDQALHTIFQVKSLGYIREGSVITILTLNEIEARATKISEISAQHKVIEPLFTNNIALNYEKAESIKKQIIEFLTGIAARSTSSTQANKKVISTQIISHAESNTLIITATAKEMERIRKIVRYLDKAPRQVIVEAKIVEASERLTKNFGLDWSLNQNLPVQISATGFIELLQGVNGSVFLDKKSTSSNAELQLSGIPFVGDIQANLNIAESEGYAKVVSTPKVVALSGKEASITRNSPILIPKTTTTSIDGNSQQSVETSDVEVGLTVTPTVTSTGGIFLNVSISRSDAGGADGAFKTVRTAKTEVLVANGQTIVIGGIYEEDESGGSTGIPFFKNIPFLSFLASNKNRGSSKTELLIFLTPRILDTQ